MSYQDELLAKLAAAHAADPVDTATAVNTESQEEKILSELDKAFEFSRYDLDESDILRTLKILNILEKYQEVFRHKGALMLFYTLVRVDVISPKRLHSFSRLGVTEFKTIIQAMARNRLLFRNENGELELTMDGKSLAARIGIESYF